MPTGGCVTSGGTVGTSSSPPSAKASVEEPEAASWSDCGCPLRILEGSRPCSRSGYATRVNMVRYEGIQHPAPGLRSDRAHVQQELPISKPATDQRTENEHPLPPHRRSRGLRYNGSPLSAHPTLQFAFLSAHSSIPLSSSRRESGHASYQK